MLGVSAPGLQGLSLIDKLKVHRLEEGGWDWEPNNKYIIKKIDGSEVYFSDETTALSIRLFCCLRRPFDLKIRDSSQNEVIQLCRPLRLRSCWCPCCLQRLEVSAPPGSVVGFVEQEWCPFRSCFLIKNAANDVVLKIRSSNERVFVIYSGNNKVGKILKFIPPPRPFDFNLPDSETSVVSEPKSEIYDMEFPMDLDVSIKAVLLGAFFLFDYMYFNGAKN